MAHAGDVESTRVAAGAPQPIRRDYGYDLVVRCAACSAWRSTVRAERSLPG